MRKPALALILSTLALMAIPSIVEASASECPVINGRYKRLVIKDGKEMYRVKTWSTRVENGTYFYLEANSQDKNYIPADGRRHPVVYGGYKAEIAHYCENGELHTELQYEGYREINRKQRLLSKFELEVTSSEAAETGIYTKEI